jgi:hypothetical protein
MLPRRFLLGLLFACSAGGFVVWWSQRSAVRHDTPVLVFDRATESQRDPTDAAGPADDRQPLTPTSAVDAPVPASTVTVSDQRGLPLRGATIRLSGAGSSRLLGRTSDEGWLIVAQLFAHVRAEADEPQLLVQCAGYASALVDLSEDPRDRIDVRLTEGAVLRGQLVDPGGVPVEASALVVATPHPALTRELVSSLFRGVERADVLWTRSDARGRFEVRDLRPGVVHSMWAAGGDWISGHATRATPSSDPVSLTVHHGWAARIVLSDETGEPVGSSDAYLVAGRDSVAVSSPDAPLRMLPPFHAQLAGLDEEALSTTASRRFLLASSTSRVPPVLRLSFEPPGYARCETHVCMEPLTRLGESTPVTLHRRAGGFGDLEVEIVGREPAGEDVERGRFTLELTSSTSGSVHLRLDTRTPTTVLRGIPTGRYSARVTARSGDFSYPERTASALDIVVDSTPARIVLDMARWARLSLSIVEPDGTAYRGPASFAVLRGRRSNDGASFEGTGDSVSFHGTPYVIQGLDAGEYALSVSHPPNVEFENASPVSLFTIDREAVVTLRASRRLR